MKKETVLSVAPEANGEVLAFKQGVLFGMKYGYRVTKRYFANYVYAWKSNHALTDRLLVERTTVTCSRCKTSLKPNEAWYTCATCHGQFCLDCEGDVSDAGDCSECASKKPSEPVDPRTAILKNLLASGKLSIEECDKVREALGEEENTSAIERSVESRLNSAINDDNHDRAASTADGAIIDLLNENGYTKIAKLFASVPRY